MQKLLRGSWLMAGLLLAVGCQSEQAAFSFRPAPRATPIAATVVAPGPLANAAPMAPPKSVPVLTSPFATATPRAIAAATAIKAPTGRPDSRRRQRPAPGPRQLVALPAPRLETTAQTAHRDTLHLLLGGALVVVGVVGGILLGGWLGLGVGAAGVLLGYYFVVMGLGGRQAWLEVFQEFFNM